MLTARADSYNRPFLYFRIRLSAPTGYGSSLFAGLTGRVQLYFDWDDFEEIVRHEGGAFS
jgi:hypothetical protein